MKLFSDVCLVGSGYHMGLGLSQKHDCNVYLLKGETGDLLIDSGLGIKPEMIDNELLKDGSGSKLKYVLHTHAHSDHCGGAYYFKKKYKCQIGLSEISAPILEKGTEEAVGMDKAKASGDYDSDYTFTGCKVDFTIKGGDKINLGDKIVNCISFPGHSPDTILFLVDGAEGRYLFSGDSLFSEGQIGLLNRDGSEIKGYRDNIYKLKDKKIDALFPGHYHFCLKKGQKIIDKISDSLKKVQLPPNFI